MRLLTGGPSHSRAVKQAVAATCTAVKTTSSALTVSPPLLPLTLPPFPVPSQRSLHLHLLSSHPLPPLTPPPSFCGRAAVLTQLLSLCSLEVAAVHLHQEIACILGEQEVCVKGVLGVHQPLLSARHPRSLKAQEEGESRSGGREGMALPQLLD